MSVTQQPINTDVITRIYKNSLGNIIAVQEVSIIETRTADGLGSFDRAAAITSATTKLNEGTSQSRSINTIQQIGKYDLFVESLGNYTSVTYLGVGTLNNLVVDLSSLPVIGNTI
jgi:hypothetical protein